MRAKIFFLFVLLGNLMYAQTNTAQIKSIDSLFETTQSKSAYLDKGSKEILRICTEVYYRSKEIQNEKGMLKAILKMVEVYINEQQYEEALKKISEGISLAETIKKYDALSQLYLSEGMVYTEIGYTKKSRQALSLCLASLVHASKENIPILKSSVYRTLARNIKKESNTDKKDSTIFYLQKGYDESKKINTKFTYKNFYLASFAQDLANEYYSQGELQKAEIYLAKFEEHLKNEKDHSDFITHYIIKGNIENKRKNFEKALEYFEASENLTKEYKIYTASLKDIYSGKAESYSGLQDYKNEALFATKAKKITDSIATVEKKILNSSLIADKANSAQENTFFKKYESFKYVLIFLLLIAGFFIYRFYSKKNNSNNETDKNMDLVLSENDEPTSNEDTDIFSEQNNDPGSERKSSIDTQSLEELITLAQNNDKYFHLKFSKLFPKFNQQLLDINAQLTQSDLEYCALIKLNLSTKEIAQYKNVTVNSVVSKKYRIRKKLNISTNENIYTWIFDIG